MKQGRTLTELAREVERREHAKRDFVADTRGLIFASNGSSLIEVEELGLRFGVGEIAHAQIAERLQVPRRYYDRLRVDHHELLDETVNYLFQNEPERRMVRTLDEQARAFLSHRYRPLDNFDLMEAVMPELGKAESLDVRSAEVTDKHLYLQVRFPHMERRDPSSDLPLGGGLMIRNSEVGLGSLGVFPMIWRQWCSNGCVSTEYGERKVHIGRAADEAGAREVYRDETLAADDKAFWMKVQDAVRAALSDPVFAKLCDRIDAAYGDKITAPPERAVELTAKRFGLGEGERGEVLRHLIDGGDLSRWGMVNAITRAAQDVPSYDRGVELEQLGGAALELPQADWSRIAVPA